MPIDVSVNNILGVVHPHNCGWTLARVRLRLRLCERDRQHVMSDPRALHRAMLTNEMANTTSRLLMPITLMRFSDNNSGRISRRTGETCTSTEHASSHRFARFSSVVRSFAHPTARPPAPISHRVSVRPAAANRIPTRERKGSAVMHASHATVTAVRSLICSSGCCGRSYIHQLIRPLTKLN